MNDRHGNFHVFDSKDADISAQLMGMVESGELQAYVKGGRG